MIHSILQNRPVVLASASPRRKQIFELIGVACLIHPSDIEENDNGRNPRQVCLNHALHKATHVAGMMSADCVVVGADTIVHLDGEILGKPRNNAEAALYLSRLSGATHSVYTGVALCCGGKTVSGVEKTLVTFRQLSDAEILTYIETREPMDKAGAYGIQGYGSQFVRKINGCYFNVMGFPVVLFGQLLEALLQPGW